MAKKQDRFKGNGRPFNSVQWKPSVEDVNKFKEYEQSESLDFEGLYQLIERSGAAVRFKPTVNDRHPTVSVTVVDPDSELHGYNVWWYTQGDDTMLTSACYFLDVIGFERISQIDLQEVLF